VDKTDTHKICTQDNLQLYRNEYWLKKIQLVKKLGHDTAFVMESRPKQSFLPEF